MDNEPKQEVEVVAKRGSSVLGVTLALLLAIAAFFSGTQFSNAVASAENQSASIFSIFARATTPEQAVDAESADLTEFWNVWKLLEERYIAASSTKQVTTEDKIYGAIEGLVNSYGDPYTVFLPPKESEAFAEDIAGNFSGIGMEVGNRDGVIAVIAPLVDTPAERAGLTSGDLIIKIDGESTEGMSIDEAVRRIRGEKGTSVTLSIFREGELEIRDITVVRDTIVIPTVKTEDKGDVFIISLYSFNAMAEAKMEEAINEYVKSDATKMVLDLRGNPGGYLQSAVGIASYFLPTGKIVVRERHGDVLDDKLYRSQGRTLGNRTPKTLVVLIDSGSASASEILAGALSEHGYATLIGVNSFGKGSVQELIDIDGGSALKVTIARWLTPNGLSISDGGLKPDILIKRTAEQRVAGEDPQLTAALDFMAGKEVVSEE
jgi:carboxyl-terminal processing protease